MTTQKMLSLLPSSRPGTMDPDKNSIRPRDDLLTCKVQVFSWTCNVMPHQIQQAPIFFRHQPWWFMKLYSCSITSSENEVGENCSSEDEELFDEAGTDREVDGGDLPLFLLAKWGFCCHDSCVVYQNNWSVTRTTSSFWFL